MKRRSPAFRMFVLIVAGEATFLLPFVVARIFRPTFLDVFQVTNLQLGAAFSLYGVVAMVSYFAGGPLADRFSARKLMCASLLLTSAGGVSFASSPSIQALTLIYGFWGLTTILLFWAALIKATREWGEGGGQGKAFGILDAGRGLYSAILASLSVGLFAAMIPTEIQEATLAQRTIALQAIIWFFMGLGGLAALLVWFCIPDSKLREDDPKTEKDESKFNLDGLKTVVKMPAVWLQSVIIICAYCGYKCTDDFSLYARDAFGFDDIEAAKVGTLSFWVRPFAAFGAGLLGDYFKSSNMLIVSFLCVMVGAAVIAAGVIPPNTYTLVFLAIAVVSAGTFALRGLYFAVFEEARVPLIFTGSAVGVVSFFGYTPDVFMGPLMGYLLDNNPGPLGHQYLFATLVGFAAVGLVATLAFQWVNRRSVSRH